MRPVHAAQEAGTLLDLYARINPITAKVIAVEDEHHLKENEAVDCDALATSVDVQIEKVADVLRAFIEDNGVLAFADPSLSVYVTKSNRVFLSTLSLDQIVKLEELACRVTLDAAPAREQLFNLIDDGKSAFVVDLACGEFARWIVAQIRFEALRR